MAPPQSAVPPTLAPSVEEAYRRKCIQLKQRMNEVEESNDAARARLTRIQRGVDKLRLERAFLMEQLAKRTSTNVEDSEGSPSPPPTPQEKPLRVKRGHRKASFMMDEGLPNPFINQGPLNTHSPSSDAFSHNPAEQNAPLLPKPHGPRVNGHVSTSEAGAKDPVKEAPRNAFDVYCKETEPNIIAANEAAGKDKLFNLDKLLAEGFQQITAEQRAHYERIYEELRSTPNVGEERNSTSEQSAQAEPVAVRKDEDIEMRDEADDPGSQAGEGNGFTAVNRS